MKPGFFCCNCDKESARKEVFHEVFSHVQTWSSSAPQNYRPVDEQWYLSQIIDSDPTEGHQRKHHDLSIWYCTLILASGITTQSASGRAHVHLNNSADVRARKMPCGSLYQAGLWHGNPKRARQIRMARLRWPTILFCYAFLRIHTRCLHCQRRKSSTNKTSVRQYVYTQFFIPKQTADQELSLYATYEEPLLVHQRTIDWVRKLVRKFFRWRLW